MAIVVKTLKDIPPYTEDDKERLEQLKNMNDEDIDFSDIPELAAEQLADAVRARELRHSLYKPVKVAIKINYDADVLQWFRSFGKGYQTRMNAALREYMLTHL
jgi:uncharacterized protein (DUF4415 family)